MISTVDVQMVRDKFSSAAERYEKLAFIQNGVRNDFFETLHIKDGSAILDVGCGTGVLLRDIARLNPSGVNVGVDPARGMVEMARRNGPGSLIVQTDAGHLPFKPGSFDLIISSSSYQWAVDLNRAFESARGVLKPWGSFQAALFGRKTLQELFDSLDAASVKADKWSRGHRLPRAKNVWLALDWAKFRDVSVHAEERTVVFHDLWSILVWLKSVGANALGRRVFLGRQALEKAQKHYVKNYSVKGGLKVTFEVIWVRAAR
jgi:malonyl-CoA O-methyltransferase